jgi:3-hydroxybutyryl-CoA dehydrogenase
MDIKKIKNISVIGAGMMGHGIAQIFASRNYQVILLDVHPDLLFKAIGNIRSNLNLMVEKGIGKREEIEPTIQKIKTTLDWKQATSKAQFVVEAVSENLELKQRIFQDLDALCSSETILATNTSVMSIIEIAKKAQNRKRILGTHFWNPPYLIPLVEVIKGEETSSQAMEGTYKLLKHVGKHPVLVKRDVPGFVGNRLQHALWREAISIVDRGIADPETVDEVIKKGFGLRLPVLGPLENADMVGLDLAMAIHDYLLKYLDSSPEPAPVLREKVKRGELGFKTGQGFQKWSPSEAEHSRTNLLEYLLKWTKEQEERGKDNSKKKTSRL